MNPFEAKITDAYTKEAQAFRTRAEINKAYVNLKKEYDKIINIQFMHKPEELHINSDLSALVVQLSDAIAKLGKRNANLQNDLKKVTERLDYHEHG